MEREEIEYQEDIILKKHEDDDNRDELNKKEQPGAQKKKNRKLPTVIIAAVLVIGICMLLYPTVSNWWNSRHQSKVINSYVESTSDLDDEEYDAILESAYEYNEWLFESNHSLSLSDDELEDYLSQLVVEDTDIMAYIVIDKIDVSLPIYHTTEDGVLQAGIGHLEGSSLPVGGESTHCVLTGHTGLASAKLFTDLDELEIGDTFKIYVLDELLTYEVDQILVVDPSDVSELGIVEGEDYCTLITCTPYGINNKRLLVRGHRIENAEEEEEAVDDVKLSEKSWIWVIALIAAAVIGDAAVIIVMRRKRFPKGEKGVSGGKEPPDGSPADVLEDKDTDLFVIKPSGLSVAAGRSLKIAKAAANTPAPDFSSGSAKKYKKNKKKYKY